MTKRLLPVVFAALLLLAAVVAVNTWRHGSRQLQVAPAPPLALDGKALADKLAGAVRLRTISSHADAGLNADQFRQLHDHIYRFSPVRAGPQDLPRLHGSNERIAVANLGELVRFYHQLLRNLNAPAP